MVIFNKEEDIINTEPAAIALGNFDGIHKGHRVLIQEAVENARKLGIRSAVFTFSENPKNVLAGHTVVKNIVYEDEKRKLIEDLGVDYLFSLPFDEKLMHQQPEDFVRETLLGRLRAATAVCGFNFTYGYKAGGNADTLLREGSENNFNVIVVPSVREGDEVVSSTLIRKYIAEGNVERSAQLLGRNYSIRGEVIHGNQIGRTIGFPTCNITVDASMVTPANGVYFTNCYIDGKRYHSVTNVGNKPTIGTYEKNIETNILDFDRDIYGEIIEVEFLKRRREETRFDGIDALKNQLVLDKAAARKYHQAQNPIALNS